MHRSSACWRSSHDQADRRLEPVRPLLLDPPIRLAADRRRTAEGLRLPMGLEHRSVLGFRRPSSWWRALGISMLVVIALLVASAIVAPFGDPEQEQGLIPSGWDSHRIAQFTAFAIVVTLVGPIVEELMFRGVGYGLLEPFGRSRAIIIVGLAFALIHGLV